MIHRFGDFELDEALFELREGGQPVQVRRKVLETILYLVRHRDRLVTRDELCAGPWAGTVVTDAAIAQAIKQARDVLGDHGDEQRVIRTVRGKGVRFVGAVVENRMTGGRSSGAARSPSGGHGPPFVGRSHELARLREALATARAGAGQALLVGGDPGIGKTALVERIASEARIASVHVSWGRGWEAGGTPAFWPWLELLRAVVDCQSFPKLGGPPEGSTRWLDFVPELRRKVLPSDAPIERPADSEHARVGVFDSITRFLVWVGGAVDMLLLIEDLHAADRDSIALLRYAAPRLRSSRLLLVATFRPDEFRLRESALGDLPDTEQLLLTGLDAEEVAELVHATAMHESPAIAEIYKLSRGNPLMVRELSTSPLNPDAKDTVRPGEPGMPAWWRACLDARISRLPPATAKLLRAAAISGRVFTLEFVATVAGLAERDVLALLQHATEHRVIEQDPLIPGLYQFSHILFRDTIDHRLTAEERYDLHARCAAILERDGQLDDDHVYRLAHHSWMSSPLARVPAARRWALEAARRAQLACAYEVASDQLAHAIELSKGPVPQMSEQLDLILQLASAQRLAGRPADALATLERAAAIASIEKDSNRFAASAIGRFDVVGDTAPLDPVLQDRVKEALTLLSEDTPRRAVLLAIQAFSRMFLRAPEEGRAIWEDAARMARACNDSGSIARVLVIGTRFYHGAYGLLSLANDGIQHAEKANNADMLLYSYLARSWSLIQLGRIAEWKAQIQSYDQLATRTRHPNHMYWATMMSSTPFVLSGDFDTALRIARRGYEMGQQVRDPLAPTTYGCCLLGIYRASEGTQSSWRVLDDLREVAEQTVALVPTFVAWRTVIANAAFAMGQVDVGTREYRRILEADFEAIARDCNYVTTLSELARAAVFVAESEDLERFYRLLLPHAGFYATSIVGHVNPVHHTLALLRKASGDFAGAKDHFERALADAERIEARPWIDRVRGDLSSLG